MTTFSSGRTRRAAGIILAILFAMCAQIDAAIAESKVAPGDIGIKIISVPEGDTLYEKNAEKLFIPASNNKLVTTAAALHYLGKDYKFRTFLYATGTLRKGGLLDGDILLVGGGDPNISGRFYGGDTTAVFRKMIEQVKKLGIKKIGGSVIADDTFFDRQYIHPDWKDEKPWSWYAAPVSALSFNDNCIDFELTPAAKAGKPVSIRISPLTSYVTLYNKCVTTNNSKKHKWGYYRKSNTNEIFFSGRYYTKAKPYNKWIAVYQPTLFAGTVFKEEMERQAVKVEGTVRLVKDANEFREVEKKRVCVFKSSLVQAIEIANKRSQNFYAEQILKTLGAEKKEHGTFQAGAAAVQDFMKEVGILPGTYSYRDGSGLSRFNKLSARQIAAVLEYMYRHKYSGQYVNSLAVAGSDGSLASRMGYAPLAGNVFAKTGSLAASGVHCISGYIRCSSGRTAAFSILFNKSQKGRLDIRRLEEKILVAIYRYGPSANKAPESVNTASKGARHLLTQN